MTHIRNSRIWITGASSGIGRAIALGSAARGGDLRLTARNQKELDRVAGECVDRGAGEALVLPADLSLSRDRDQAIASAGDNTDILILNAGLSQRSMAVDTNMTVTRKIMELNFFSAVVLCKAVLPPMLRRGYGHIVIISSITGKFGVPWRSSYCASKHALQGYFESLRSEVEDKGIRVTIVNPGRVKTNISVNALDGKGAAHNKMDPGQAGGVPAGRCASRILNAVECNRREINIGGKELFVLHLRRFLPAAYFRMIRKIETR